MNEKANRIILHTKIGKKFINLLMVNGQKNKAEQIFLQTLELLGQNAVYTLLEALKNVRPILEVRSIRLRGANYQVPVPLTENRRMSLAIK
jgi:small subunit ribosomal protein S7